jgi:hypothetical protein
MSPIQSGRVDRSCGFWVLFLAGRSTPDLIVFTFLAAKKYRDILLLNICRKKHHVRCYDADPVNSSFAS